MRANPPNIEIYPMQNTSDGGATITEDRNNPDFYDVIVRYDGDDPLDEVEDLTTWDEVQLAVAKLQEKYPDAPVVEIQA